MARMARVVVPGVPHHVTQRGNRRQTTFFEDGDYEIYKSLMAEWCLSRGVEVWAYCLMPNHVHLVVVPSTEQALRAAIGEAHRRYTVMVNTRQGWKGCLWQGRFASFPMAPGHLFYGARYIELNPVRAGLVKTAEDWPHSSARAHLSGRRACWSILSCSIRGRWANDSVTGARSSRSTCRGTRSPRSVVTRRPAGLWAI